MKHLTENLCTCKHVSTELNEFFREIALLLEQNEYCGKIMP